MKKLDFSNIKIIHKFKRANLVEAEQMLSHSINLNNLTLVYEINDLKKLDLLIKHGLSVAELTQKKVYGTNNDVHLLHNISTEKLNFLLSNGLELLNFCPLSHLHTPDNFNAYINYLSGKSIDPVHYFLENERSTKSFIANTILKKHLETIDIIAPFLNQNSFWELGILKAIESVDIDSLYFLYKRNILNQDLFLRINLCDEMKKILERNINACKRDIDTYYNNLTTYSKYGYNPFSNNGSTLNEKKRKNISMSYAKKSLYKYEQKLSKINKIWSNSEQFLAYFIEKEEKELQQILNNRVCQNKKRL